MDLTSKQPTQTNALKSLDCISRQAAIEDIRTMIPKDARLDIKWIEMWLKQLPPVTPKQRTGHWHITDAYPHNVYCSECHKRFAQTHWAVWEDGSLPRNFCPNCGAKMTEGDAE